MVVFEFKKEARRSPYKEEGEECGGVKPIGRIYLQKESEYEVGL